MGNNVSLTPETEDYANELVASGFYKTKSELIREALRLHKKLEGAYIKEMHEMLAIGKDQMKNGETKEFDIDAIINDAKKERSENL